MYVKMRFQCGASPRNDTPLCLVALYTLMTPGSEKVSPESLQVWIARTLARDGSWVPLKRKVLAGKSTRC